MEEMYDDGPLLRDTNASVRLLGEEALLFPFLQFTSSQRVSMAAAHIVQALPPERAEQSYIYTGYESVFSKYIFDQTKRDQEIYIVDVVPKYPENRGARPLKMNPRYTVIYIGREDGLVHYFHLDKYFSGTEGYGIQNEWVNTHLLKPDMIIPKDIEFCRSSSKIGNNGYGMGVNANVAFVTLPEVNNDAFMISDRLAKKFTMTSINTLNIEIKPNQIPLNLYGDNEEHKFIPDIGEFVRDDGIVCGFRNPTDATLISDMMTLSTPHILHDDLCYAPPGSQIIDIDFYTSSNRHRVKTNRALFSQVDKYLELTIQYWSRIMKAYDTLKKKGVPLSPEFNTLITRGAAILSSLNIRIPGFNKRADIKLCKGKERIEFIYMRIKYLCKKRMMPAWKLSDRAGCKGVISCIRPLEEMPKDDYGFTVDMVIDPHAVSNRMNPSQLYEAGINRCSVFVQRQALEKYNNGDITGAIEHIIEYISMINPAYGELVGNKFRSDPIGTMEYIKKAEESEEVGIFLMIPPFLKTIGPDLILTLEKKYNIKSSPVTFYPLGKNGVKHKSRTRCNVSIGSKYIYSLYKIPHAKAPGLGFINQFKVPVKPSQFSRTTSQISFTPLRLGEDETRIGTMCCGSEAIVRLMGLHANSFEAVTLTAETLLREKYPTRIDRINISDKEIEATNNIIGVSKHMLATMGIDANNTTCEVFNEAKFIADLGSQSFESI